MNFISLPTVSLYKFMTITGLLLYLFCFYKYESKAIEIEKTRAEENYTFTKDTLELSYRINSTKTSNSPGAKQELEKLIREKAMMSKRASDRIEANKISGFYIVGFFVGGCLFVFGTGLWYYRIQKYQDMILKKQAEGNDAPAI